MLILGGCLAIYLKIEERSTESTEPGDGGNMDGINDDINDDINDGPLSVPPGKPAGSVDDSPEFVGNTGSGVFHNTQCPYSTGKNCTVSFSTGEEAVQAGYKPCGICKP